MTPHWFSALVCPIAHSTYPKCQNDFLLDHFKRLVGAIQFGRELSTRSVHCGPPQPAIMFVSRGLARNARDLCFCTLLAQWSPVLLQPPERQIVTLPDGLIATR